MDGGYKKCKHRPRQRDNYIDRELLYEEPPTRKLVKHEGFNKHERIKDLRKQLDSNNQLFSQLKLPPIEGFLRDGKKAVCAGCNKNNRFYCLNCLLPNPNHPLPRVRLPCNTVILHHPQEKASKSSGLPLVLLSQEVNMVTYQEDMLEELFKAYSEEDTYVLYPHKDSITVTELTHPPKNIIAIDCTWFQTNTVLRHLEKAKKFRYVKLQDYETQFWRYQNHGAKALSTAEAVFYFYREFAERFEQGYHHQYDELLFLYVTNYHIIEEYHKGGKEVKPCI